eukprot:7742687-Lingulodinium_polyedra.AAC.1
MATSTRGAIVCERAIRVHTCNGCRDCVVSLACSAWPCARKQQTCRDAPRACATAKRVLTGIVLLHGQ